MNRGLNNMKHRNTQTVNEQRKKYFFFRVDTLLKKNNNVYFLTVYSIKYPIYSHYKS